MKQLNFLSKSSSQSCGYSSVTLAATVGSPSAHRRGAMQKLISVLVLIFTFGCGEMWGDPTLLFKQTFGNNPNSATAWDEDTYSVKTGVSEVYADAEESVTSAKVSKNTMGNGSSSSALVSSQGGTGCYIVGPLDVSAYTSLTLSNAFGMTSGSWANSSFMRCYYSTTGAADSYTEMTRSSTNPSTAVSSNAHYVTATYTVPAEAESSTLYLKFEFYCYQIDKKSNAIGQAYLDDVELSGVENITLSSIAITTQPTKRKYLIGESFSSTGAVVTATMSNSDTKTVTATWTPSSAFTTTGSKTITASYTEGGINKTTTTSVDVYSVTVEKYDEEGVEITDAGVTASCSVKTLSQNVGSTDYKFKEWQVTAGGMSVSSNSLTGTPTGNVTVRAIFYKPISVTWVVNGEPWTGKGGSTTAKYDGKVANVPTAPNTTKDGCGDKFMGWTNVNIEDAVLNKDVPADATRIGTLNCFTDAEHSPTIKGTTIFYAVFAEYVEK